MKPAQRFSWISALVALIVMSGPLANGAAAADASLDIHVATDGNDSWNGAAARRRGDDGPLASVHAAQRVARARIAEQRGARTVRVLIQPGVYALDQPLTLTPEDSGTTYQAQTPGSVVLSGGRSLAARAGPTAAGGRPGERVFDVPGADAALWIGAPQLYVDGRRAVLAREPEVGREWFVGQPVGTPNEKPKEQGHEAFRAAADVLAWLGRLEPSDRERAVLDISQSWSNGRHRLARDAAPPDSVRVSPRSRWPFQFFGNSQRFHVENVVAAFDQPGEWIGTGNTVRYLPRPGDKAQASTILATLDRLVVLRGAGPAGPYVENVQLRGLTLSHARSLTPTAGWVDNQAAIDIGAAVEADFVRKLTIEACTFSDLGGYAVWLRNGVRDSVLTRNTLTDLGAGAVKIGQPSQRPGDDAATGSNTFSFNTVSDTGQLYPGAVGIWIGQSFDNTVASNTVRRTSYTAISVGWQWGYGTATSGRNRIERNKLLDIGQGKLSDLGGIYTLGPSPGTVIRGNVIREVRGYKALGAAAWGIYNDEGSSGVLVEDNIVAGTDGGAYHLHYGRDITVQNNWFALGDGPDVTVTRAEPGDMKLALRNNLIVRSGNNQVAVRTPAATGIDTTGTRVAGAGAAAAGGPVGCQRCAVSSASITTGPTLEALMLKGDDAASTQRFAAVLSGSGAGPSTTPAAVREAPAVAGALPAPTTAAPTAAAPRAAVAVAGPAALKLDTATAPLESQPAGLVYLPAKTDAIAVAAQGGAPGGRCLRFSDGPGFAQRYEPYAFARLNHTAGTSRAEFALVIDDRSDFIHEWRDGQVPYLVGPSLRFTRDGIHVGGRQLMAARPGDWLQVRVTAPLQAGATWRLDISSADGRTQTFDKLAMKDPQWNSLRWLGFISNAAVESQACLAGLVIDNTPTAAR